MIPAAEAATVEARPRAPRETKRGAAATSFMKERRLLCSSLSGDMVSFPTAAIWPPLVWPKNPIQEKYSCQEKILIELRC